MMYKGSTPIDTMYLGGKMVTKVYLGNEKVYPLQGVIPKAIKDAMVLWYDISKQQATNEGMATTPVLRDLSGNGHDATCYNFAWSGMSGIGGYVQSNFNIRSNDSSIYARSVSGNIVTYRKTDGSVMDANALALFDNGTNWNKDVETKVKAGKYGLNVYVTEQRGVNPKNILSIPPYEIGSLTYAQSDYDDGKNTIMFGNTIEVPAGDTNSFEFLPQYPNALVSDGVDDYAMVQNKYAVDFTYQNEYNGLWIIDSNRATGTIEKSKITITSISNLSIQVYYQCTNSQAAFNVPKTKVKITGLTDGQTISYYDSSNSFEDILIDSDGIYELPTFESKGNGMYYGFKCNKLQDTCDITIEQLPINKSLILTKEQGFTVLAKRKWISDINSKSQGFATKGTSTVWIDGAFCFECVEANGASPFNRVFSIGQKGANYIRNFTENDITYLTSKEYNGSPLKKIGDAVDTDGLQLFKLAFNNINLFSSIALYSFILFDRDLTEEEIEWVKANLVEDDGYAEDWYGVEFYTTDPNPDCIRIGNPELHKTLPVHTQMKGCLLSDDGTVNKYLNATDWTSETRDGSQGQVMVEMPKNSYWKFETDGDTRRVKFSTKPLPGFSKTPQGYVSAYQATVQRSTSKLASVVNTTTDYRGGDNSADRDGTYRSQLGIPASSISRTNFRNYARNRKSDSTEWNCMVYDMQKLLYWLFVVEYATLNSQKTFNSDKDSNGLAQGGLGNGVTNLNLTLWRSFNDQRGFIPCGYTDSMGNGTGQLGYTMPFEYESNGAANYAGDYDAETAYTNGQFVSQGDDIYECIANAEAGTELTNTTYFTKKTRTVTYVARYRGIENPFGHLWQCTDGIDVQTEPGDEGLSKVFVCSDPSKFNDTNYDGYSYIGNEARTAGYVKEVIFGEGGEIMPKVVGDSPAYFCDYHHVNIPTTGTLRGVQFGGSADLRERVGFVYADSTSAPSNGNALISSRLCFIPNNND